MDLYFEDGLNVRYNRVTMIGGGCIGCMSYPAVIGTPIFSDEDETEPVDRATAKSWCRIDGNDDDALVDLLITTAREQCEAFVNRTFIARTVTATVRAGTKLPYGPVDEIEGITTQDGATISGEYKDLSDGVYVVTYSVAPPDPIPSKYKTAVLNQVAYLYDHRGDEAEGELSPGTKAILKPLRIV